MNVLRSSEVPKYLRADETLTYPVGSQVIINANHAGNERSHSNNSRSE